MKTKRTSKPSPKLKPDWLDELNREQRQAVEHGIKRHGRDLANPLAIIAGAGTGKTAVLACRTALLSPTASTHAESC